MQHPASTTVTKLFKQEQLQFVTMHPKSAQLQTQSESHFLFGVPMHWMRDWPNPHSLFIANAQGAQIQCVDGITYSDFCLGDTGAMFGHSPSVVANALADQGRLGLTCMLPSERTARVGVLLSQTFGLPFWQMTLSASDANRFILRWARAITGKQNIVVFDGCYHGAVDETLVDLVDDEVVDRASTLGRVHSHAPTTRVVPFNDLSALKSALSDGQVACLLAEPALTNCGLVLPEADFWPQAIALCKQQDVLVIMDETHTLSTAPGGYAKLHQLDIDMFVAGKAIAAGLPCAVYGFTHEVAQRMQSTKANAPEGHSGIGTTLSANMLTMAVLEQSLLHLHTPDAYVHMQRLADALEQGLNAVINSNQLQWTVTRLGARMELQFMAQSPRHAQEVRDADSFALEQLLHLFMLNRGVILTPFHCMMLLSPATTQADVQKLLTVFAMFVQVLKQN